MSGSIGELGRVHLHSFQSAFDLKTPGSVHHVVLTAMLWGVVGITYGCHVGFLSVQSRTPS